MAEETIRIDWQDLCKPITRPTGKSYKVIVKREPVPIVFLPGIMGTRLRLGDDKDVKVWDPDAGGFMFWNYYVWGGARRKQRMLLGKTPVYKKAFLVPHEDDADHNNKFSKRYPLGAERGWGGVFWDSYGIVLRGLQDREWAPLVANCFDLPVYAMGYDWRGSAEEAGNALKERVAKIKAAHPGCKKVILVTHSMGGLVARSACKAGLEADVLGVIHTVQPVTGAPAAYWRMKAGFERIGKSFTDRVTASVLGANGLEVTALLGHMPGGLQLLPTATHTANDGSPGWLLFSRAGDNPIRLPRSGDPYAEIYREETASWRLVLWKDYLAGRRQAEPKERDTAWRDFLKRLAEAESFHKTLAVYQHPQSYHFFGQGRETADTVTMTAMQLEHSDLHDPFEGRIEPPPVLLEKGSFTYVGPVERKGGRQFRTSLTMSQPDGDGDSTVPRSSGSILTAGGRPGIPLVDSGHDSCFKDLDLLASQQLHPNICQVIEGLCMDKIKAEKRWP